MNDRLLALYRARRAALEAEALVFDVDDEAELIGLLSVAIDETRALPDRTERSFRLQVLADLLARVDDDAALRLLLTILNDPDDSVRARAARAFARLASMRLPEAVRVVMSALDEGFEGPALVELPALLLDACEDDTPPVEAFVRLLDRDDPDVAAEAACALAEILGSGARELLESFIDDERALSNAVDGPATLGDLIADLVATMDLEDGLMGHA